MRQQSLAGSESSLSKGLLPPWRISCNPSNEGRTYVRPLGTTELYFYWESKFCGATDILHHIVVDVVRHQPHQDVFAPERVQRAWIHMKRRFPLLGAHLQEDDDRRNVYFVVNDVELERLSHPDEIQYGRVSSENEVLGFIERLINGERHLSTQLLARLFIFAQQDTNQYHILFHTAHLITDGIAKYYLIRYMLEELASPSNKDVSWDLGQRLALAVPLEDLAPIMKLSPARQRWRRAVASVIYASRLRKSVGGHTLPRTYTKLTRFTPSVSARRVHVFSIKDSMVVIKNCKNMGLTFGSTLPVIGQVALARLLCRRYLQGRISPEEWEFRKKEPMTTVGPFNSRHFLDKQWYEQGGASNVCTSIGYYSCMLPFMPLGTASHLIPGDNVPSYHELLSFGRFVLRSKSIQKQTLEQFKHPLFLDIASAALSEKTERVRETALTWREAYSQARGGHDVKPISVMEESRNGLVLTHGGSSFGNIDNITPHTYDGSHAKLEMREMHRIVRTRSDQLYLTSGTVDKKLGLLIMWDKNVYDEAIVAEWLGELVEATNHYLVGDTLAKL